MTRRGDLVVALKRNLAWTVLGQVAFFLFQFAGTVILARILAPYEMGVYAIGAAIVGVVTIVQSFGLASFIVSQPDLSRDHVATVFTLNALISAVLASLILGASFGAHYFSAEGGVAKVLRALAVLPLIGIFQLVPHAQLERHGLFRRLVPATLLRQITATVCTVGFAFAGFSYMSLPYGQICGAVVSATLLSIFGWKYLAFRFSLREWRPISTFGVHVFAISGVNSLTARISETLLGKIDGLASLGLFTRASTLFNTFWTAMHEMFGRVLFSNLAARKREGQPLGPAYLSIVEMMTAVLWPAFLGLAVLSRPFFHMIYGDRWVPAAVPFSLLAVSAVVQVSMAMSWELFMICGETGRQMRIEIVRSTLGVLAFTGACFISLNAAASVRILEALVTTIAYRRHIERMTDTTLKDMLMIYARSAVLSVAAVGPAAWLMTSNGAAPDTSPLLVGASIVAGVALWLVALAAIRHPLYFEVRKFAARLWNVRTSSA